MDITSKSAGRATRTAHDAVALAVIAVLGLVIYGWIVIGGVGIIAFSDSADYLFFADFYRGQFYGEVRPQDLAFYWATRFPPLFPLVLAAFGGGTHDLQHTQLIACCITLAMFAMLWVWLRRETRDTLSAATITVLTVASPGLFLLTLNPVSEPLAMALTWLSFALAQDAGRRTSFYLMVALAAGLASLARSIDIALVLAVPIWLLMQPSRPRRWWMASTVAFTPFAAWMIYRRTIPNTTAYTDAMDLTFAISELGGWPELLYLHPWRLITALTRNFDSTPDAWSIFLTLVLIAAASAGWWLRVRGRRLDAIFLAIYTGIILVWPYPREAARFITLILPLILFYAWLGLGWIARWLGPAANRTTASVGLAAIVLLASAGTIAHFVHLAAYPLGPELQGEQREAPYFLAQDRTAAEAVARRLATIRIAAREVARIVPENECVYAVMPYLIERHAPIRVRPYPIRLNDHDPVEVQLSGCGYLFVVGIPGAREVQVPFFPMPQLDDRTRTIFVATADQGTMVAALLTWTPEVEQRRLEQSRTPTIGIR